MAKSTKNTLAGKHPAYKKLKMSVEAIKKKRKRDAIYNKKPSAVAHRVELNKANRKAGTYGAKDGLDIGHTSKGKLVQVKASINRAANGQGKRSKFHV